MKEPPTRSGIEAKAQNIVLFVSTQSVHILRTPTLIHGHLQMPYMHWDTSRNQQRFSRIIDNIVDKKKRADMRTQKDARRRWQRDREELTKPERPPPTLHPKSTSSLAKIQDGFRRRFKIRVTNKHNSEWTASDTNEEKQSEPRFAHMRSMTEV